MSKKILVIGGGGREHAIIKALKKSPDCGEIWCAPGNGGIRYDAKCKNIKATDVETMVGFAVEEKFDYVVVANKNWTRWAKGNAHRSPLRCLSQGCTST